MSVYFLDSSGIIKHRVAETGSSFGDALFDENADSVVFIARITAVEMISAITRRARGGSISIVEATESNAEIRQWV